MDTAFFFAVGAVAGLLGGFAIGYSAGAFQCSRLIDKLTQASMASERRSAAAAPAPSTQAPEQRQPDE